MPDEQTDDGAEPGAELPQDVVDAAVRLTRLAREAVDDQEASAHRKRRSELLAEYGYTARVREGDEGATLVCHPAAWLDEDGVVDFDAIESMDRATEVRLDGPGEQGTWADVEARNGEIVATVREAEGAVHAANVRAFADFMGNHHATPIPAAEERHVREFLEEYYPRNAWPTDEERAVVERSLRLAFEIAENRYPLE